MAKTLLIKMKDRAKVFSFLITFAVESELIIDRGWMEDGDNKELMNIFSR